MIYHTFVWINNKMTFVISDSEPAHENTLNSLKEEGGQPMVTCCFENEIHEVLVNRTEKNNNICHVIT